MGVDIHMNIVNSANGEIVMKNIYKGRNSEWFSNLTGRGNDFEYEHFPKSYSNEIPKSIKLNEEKLDEDGYYGFSYVKVSEFIKWFLKYKPQLKAGWVTTYDKWRIENKGYIPEEAYHYLDSNDRIEDYHFIEYVDKYDCSLYIYDEITSNFNATDIENFWIVYYFDC